jgi:hypothetical protein
MKCIVFEIDNSISVMAPTDQINYLVTAMRDVPDGVPFIIIDISELPDAPKESWVVDFSNPDGIGGRFE